MTEDPKKRKGGKKMVTVNVKQLVSAIEEAEAFRLPDMNEGTGYLYGRVYGCLSEGRELRLSEIDFERFDLEDIDSMRDLYSETLECSGRKADALARALLDIPPHASASAFV